MIHVTIAVAAAAAAAAAALRASRHWLRTRTNRIETENRKQPTPAVTEAKDDSQRGMCSSQCETSSATSVLPSGSARIEPITTASTASDRTANSRSRGRRTRT